MIWSRKQFKKNGKTALKRNYGFAVAVCFLIAFIAGEASDSVKFIVKYDATQQAAVDTVNSVSKITNENAIGDILGDFRNGIFNNESESGNNADSEFNYDSMPGNEENQDEINNEIDSNQDHLAHPLLKINDELFTTLIEEITDNNTTFARAYEANKEFLIVHKAAVIIAIGIGSILLTLFRIFVSNGLIIGKRRFFMENRIEKEYKTPVDSILHTFHRDTYFNTAKIMFFRDLYQFLWAFTIIGGIIKLYQYRFIPYILAENPNISKKEAFELTKTMTKGYKWKLFVFDLSFIFWKILESVTLGIAGVFFVEPYKMAAETEAYTAIRAEMFAQHKSGYENFGIPVFSDWTLYKRKEKEVVDYAKWYGFSTYLMFFFTFAILGWVWEVALHFVQTGELVKRGVLLGPWLPIYGTGATGVLILLRKFFDKPLLTFSLTMLMASCIEYFTSWALEMKNGIRWWDYSGYFMNINGRICLEGAVIFGIGGILVAYIFAPLLWKFFLKISMMIKIVVCVILLCLFVLDECYSFHHPNIGKGITANVEKETDGDKCLE